MSKDMSRDESSETSPRMRHYEGINRVSVNELALVEDKTEVAVPSLLQNSSNDIGEFHSVLQQQNDEEDETSSVEDARDVIQGVIDHKNIADIRRRRKTWEQISK